MFRQEASGHIERANLAASGIENLTAILRRSRWILLVLVVLGVVQMNIVRSQQGPLYSAHAQVILSPTDLATAIAGLNTYVDPTLLDQTEQALADSIDNRRQSVSSVSMDEEMTNLVKFQRAYQASSRAMSTMDEMLDVLINRTGKVGL